MRYDENRRNKLQMLQYCSDRGSPKPRSGKCLACCRRVSGRPLTKLSVASGPLRVEPALEACAPFIAPAKRMPEGDSRDVRSSYATRVTRNMKVAPSTVKPIMGHVECLLWASGRRSLAPM